MAICLQNSNLLFIPPKKPHLTLMGVPLRVFVTVQLCNSTNIPTGVYNRKKNPLGQYNPHFFFHNKCRHTYILKSSTNLHSIMQVRAHNRENRARGGRRLYNYGATFEQKKATLMSAEGIHDAYLAVCACDPQCGWKCANDLWNFTERIENLRAPRFKGQSLKRPRRAHRSP